MDTLYHSTSSIFLHKYPNICVKLHVMLHSDLLAPGFWLSFFLRYPTVSKLFPSFCDVWGSVVQGLFFSFSCGLKKTNDRNRIKTLRFLQHSIKICVYLNVKVAPTGSTKSQTESVMTHLPLQQSFVFLFVPCLLWSLLSGFVLLSPKQAQPRRWRPSKNAFDLLKIVAIVTAQFFRGACWKKKSFF